MLPFSKLLVACRGEVALRMIAAARLMDIQTVAAYSTADRNAMHIQLADECICVGPPPINQSYTNINSLIAAAQVTGCQAIFPGYNPGIYNADLFNPCIQNGIMVMGPQTGVLRKSLDKFGLKRLVKKTGVLVIPGNELLTRNPLELKRAAIKAGFPLWIKVKIEDAPKAILVEKEEAFDYTLSEYMAQVASNALFYVEKKLENFRTIKVFTLADQSGRVLVMGDVEVLFEHQKQIYLAEGAPSRLSDDLRARMADAAIRVTKAVGNLGIGTTVFTYDKSKTFHFVDFHPFFSPEMYVGEVMYSCDFFVEHLKILAGKELPKRSILHFPHAFMAGIYANDTTNYHSPQYASLDRVFVAQIPNAKVFSASYHGYTLPLHYDTQLATMVAAGHTRAEAQQLLKTQLLQTKLEGLKTNRSFIEGLLTSQFLNKS